MQFRGGMIAPSVFNEANVRVTSAVRDFERGVGVIVPYAVSLFLQTLVIESLYLHHEEWRVKTDLPFGYRNLDPQKDADAVSIGKVIEESLKQVLGESRSEAEPWSPGGVDLVTATSVIKTINRRWCKIFPFCR